MQSDLVLRPTRPFLRPALLTSLLIGVASMSVTGCALVDKLKGDQYASQQTKEAQAQQAADSTPAAAPAPSVATAPATPTPEAAPTPPVAPIEAPAVAGGLALTVGTYNCELERHVIVKSIAADGKSLVLGWSNAEHNLTAVRAQSGALRFDDSSSGLSWITIVGKSLLINVKAGQQLANECKYASASTVDPSPPPAVHTKPTGKRPARHTPAKKEG